MREFKLMPEIWKEALNMAVRPPFEHSIKTVLWVTRQQDSGNRGCIIVMQKKDEKKNRRLDSMHNLF